MVYFACRDARNKRAFGAFTIDPLIVACQAGSIQQTAEDCRVPQLKNTSPDAVKFVSSSIQSHLGLTTSYHPQSIVTTNHKILQYENWLHRAY